MKGVVFGRASEAALAPEDQRMLSRIVQRAIELAEGDDERGQQVDLGAFENMIARNRALSDKQRAWVKDVYDRLFDDPQYENLASSGRLCRGRPVGLPKVLLPQNLPKKPPQRRRDTDAEED